jgi:hypothetical protein
LAIVLLIANANEKNDDCRLDNKMEKEKRKKIKEEILNLIVGRKFRSGIKHFQTASFKAFSARP